ncbi:cobalt ECF transporter T component CbiQ [Azovibrio restrictus]|uniref:cobalt ECF transporter T component CbiQ n=1 Tax=Azovibrio restrictus TaxID=146938 RepID=UPI0026EF7142|nr:cobalt ECF transporter T component CbiQ [Azovibrio restrictus]
MLIDRCAHASPWRRISPAAKGLFALAALLGAYLAPSPGLALGLASGLALLTLAGARVPLPDYLRAAAPALGFLALGCASLLFSLGGPEGFSPRLLPEALDPAVRLGARSLAALAALLFLVLSTPLPHLIALLRQLRCPEVLLDLMALCYRMLFVFACVFRDGRTAQAARLGHAGAWRSLRSLGLLAAGLLPQVWLRALELHQAAQLRLGDGPLRFLAPNFPRARQELAWAAATSLGLLLGLGALA